MKVTLRTKKLSNGNESIYLDITDKGERRYEYLRLYLVPEVDATAKRLNANAMKKANEIRNKFILGQNKPKAKGKDSDSIAITLMEWYDEYERHMLQDRNISVAVKDHLHLLRPILEGFLKEKRLKYIKLKAFGRKEVLGFINYMKDWKAEKREKLSQGTMVTYQQRFIALFNAAIEEGLIDRNPFNLIDDKERIQKYIANKEALTMDEVEKFANVTPGKEEDAEVQRAFLFGCLTGLRLSDIRDLEWKDIKLFDDYSAIIKEQVKTGIMVNVPICETAKQYMPEMGEDKNVFHLPKKTGTRLGLIRLVKASGIEKDVTFHTSRHTFASLTFAATSDIATTSRLLGHTSVATTELYADVAMDAKVTAISKLTGLFD